MKKRILSLAMAACLALSMMLTLSACGKKNLEEYFNTDTMQKLVTSSVEQYESQGMELKMYAEGDELHYDLTLTTIETTDDDRSVYAEALEAGLAETAQTFVDAAKDVQKLCLWRQAHGCRCKAGCSSPCRRVKAGFPLQGSAGRLGFQ